MHVDRMAGDTTCAVGLQVDKLRATVNDTCLARQLAMLISDKHVLGLAKRLNTSLSHRALRMLIGFVLNQSCCNGYVIPWIGLLLPQSNKI
jgi:hypothetical protein